MLSASLERLVESMRTIDIFSVVVFLDCSPDAVKALTEEHQDYGCTAIFTRFTKAIALVASCETCSVEEYSYLRKA